MPWPTVLHALDPHPLGAVAWSPVFGVSPLGVAGVPIASSSRPKASLSVFPVPASGVRSALCCTDGLSMRS